MEALRAVRATRPGAAPLVSTLRDDAALIDDLPFKVDADMRDLGAVTLLLGVRDNDLKGRDPNEIDSLALIHGDPAAQREHCLRGTNDDEPNGTQPALADCRAFIAEMFADALEGLDAAGNPTLDNRFSLPVGLSLRGKLQVSVPRFYARLGQALHALQDGFTHTYRRDDRTRVSVTLNYLDALAKDYDPTRDGPEHSTELDACDATDALRVRNRALAVEASTAVLDAALAPGTTAQKAAALDVVLNRYFSFEPGCTAANGWCNSPEATIEAQKGCGCGAGAGGLLGLGALAFFARRRRFARGALLALCLIAPLAAQAQSAEPAKEPVPVAPGAAPVESEKAAVEGTTVPITPDEVKAVQKEEKSRDSLFGIYAAGAGSLYNVAVVGMLGLRLRFSDNWHLGLDAELNGWYGIHARRMRTGSSAFYLSVIYRYPLKYEQINLRSNLQLGIAVQMFDLVGVPKGSIGFFGGINPLGIEVKLAGHLYLIFYPLGFAMPVTQVTGAPFAFPQFRTTLGLEVTF